LKIVTAQFGSVEIEEEKIITMPLGLLGFPENRRFVIFQHKANSPFFWYQSLDDPGLAFVITNPLLFKPDYQVNPEAVLEEMEWSADSKFDLFVIVTIPKGRPQDMTANLIGPILVNLNTQEAVQMIISNTPYTHKYPLL
jgi:flagellar assembly factor FliW